MPSPFLHMYVAQDSFDRLGLLEALRPAYVFGSIAADARLITGQPRGETHFWDTQTDVSGGLKLLAAHPHLAAARLDAGARAFVAGYLCHLMADEQWTFTIYRPYFGRHSQYRGGPEGAERQWALHVILDAELEARPPGVRDVVAQLRQAERVRLAADLLPFMPTPALHRWRETVIALSSLAPGAARYLHLEQIAGMATADPAEHAQRAARQASFLRRLPTLEEHARAYVGREALAECARRAIGASTTIVPAYLRGEALQPPMGTADPTTSG